MVLNQTTSRPCLPRVVTDEAGAVVSRHDYMAFGEEIFAGTASRTGNDKYSTFDDLRQQFTGYERDVESGLDYAQARYYHSRHGRFTSPDPLTASATIRDPQSFNRYSYALNSPYKFTDPLGLLSMHTTGANGRNWDASSLGGAEGAFSSAFSGFHHDTWSDGGEVVEEGDEFFDGSTDNEPQNSGANEGENAHARGLQGPLDGPFVLPNYGSFENESRLGTGDCVAFPQGVGGVTPYDVPNTRYWVRGPAVLGNSKIQPGTLIATFDENWRYPKEGGRHVAFYVSQERTTIKVLDQFKTGQDGKPRPNIGMRDIGSKVGEINPSNRQNDARAFYVVYVHVPNNIRTKF